MKRKKNSEDAEPRRSRSTQTEAESRRRSRRCRNRSTQVNPKEVEDEGETEIEVRSRSGEAARSNGEAARSSGENAAVQKPRLSPWLATATAMAAPNFAGVVPLSLSPFPIPLPPRPFPFLRDIKTMNDSTSNQLNESDLDYSFETNQADETRCIVDEQFVPRVGMIYKILEEVGKFYKNYSKLIGFSTKIRNTTRKGDEIIKNKLIVCSKEGRWKSKISLTLKTNPSAGINCPARIYVHIMKDVNLWTISKVVLNHSYPCCPDRADMLKQHRELSMFVRCTIETNKETRIKPSKNYQLFVAKAVSHRKLSFIEKDARNYITREVQNVFEQDDAKEFGKYNMVFGSFVGVNNHSQSTLFGCTLMKNEDIQSFKWLFECWFHCIEGKAPKDILTD
ncbi:hypothetical protein Ahy_A04g019224 [Arachis hypogaea]|uniref:Uncharacterized protein n=1 Tax=Arachis hypogaea TaxID=3818 RepID=A0A445DFI5_ARAHY|nr:hypothetical protein Ahy_A04g019224 [Arachis hypogaea]